MKDEVEVTEKPLETRPSFWSYPRRVIARVFATLGWIADLLGIYAFGESHHWWEFPFALSPGMKEALWMLAVGLGGPWAMILGAIAAAKLSEIFSGDRTVTASLINRVIDVGVFFALLHCSEMSFGVKIFAPYLNGGGFAKVVLIYLITGVAIGLVAPLLVRATTKKSRAIAKLT
jgi:hypothetical protein